MQDSDGAPAGAGTTVSTYVAGKRDGEIQMIKLPGQSGREHLKDAQVYDVSSCSDIKYTLLGADQPSCSIVDIGFLCEGCAKDARVLPLKI